MSRADMTVANALWPQTAANRALRTVSLMLGASLALAISAHIAVPFWPVPVTMQSLVVLALGAGLGWRLAGASLALYLAQGSLGLPVFANAAGLMGPTGGYLVGFVMAAMLVGYLAEKGADKRMGLMFATMLLGAGLIYLPGVAWLANFTGAEKAFELGLYPFILGDVLKAAIAALGFKAFWSLAR